METTHNRLKKLERAVSPAEEIRVFVNWENDDFVTDFQTGERISEDEWHRRFPDEILIRVNWNDGLYDEDDEDDED